MKIKNKTGGDKNKQTKSPVLSIFSCEILLQLVNLPKALVFSSTNGNNTHTPVLDLS